MSDAPALTADRLDRIERLLAEVLERLERPAERYLSIEQAAAYCAVSDDTIRRAISGGHITALRPARGRIVIDRAEVDGWLRSTAVSKLRRGRGTH